MATTLSDLAKHLSKTEALERAVELTLHAMLVRATEFLAASRRAPQSQILRGMVHLRPSDVYRGLWVLENVPGARATIPQGDEMLPSATVWRYVESESCPLVVDVMASRLTIFGGETIQLEAARSQPEENSLAARAERQGLATTHILVIPLRSGQVAGMISLEAYCEAGPGSPYSWPDLIDELEAFAALAAPTLLSRPRKAAVPVAPDDLLPVIGRSMEGMIQLLQIFAQQSETILIAGPTGAGKSRLARWCHAQSSRRDGPFETISLQSGPPKTQMAELFGWKKGAFTGAIRDQQGYVARANGGTLFLDEVDKLSLSVQAGLLRLLEERRYRMLGDATSSRTADVRFIVGTNINLRDAVASGQFREDLYYRINVLPVELPSLDARSDEIADWAAFMLRRRHTEAGLKGATELSPDARRALLRVSWPGNLRQLDNVIRRAYVVYLAERSDIAERLLLEASHVEQAMALERGGSQAALLDTLKHAAKAYVLEAERRQIGGGVLGLDLAEAFSALVLEAAVGLKGVPRDAFLLFGQSRLVENRNHRATLVRAYKRLLAALEAAGEVPDGEVLKYLNRQE